MPPVGNMVRGRKRLLVNILVVAFLGVSLASVYFAVNGVNPITVARNIFANVVECFPAGTKITLFNGEKINIEDLKPGTKLLSQNENGTKSVSTVEKLLTLRSFNMCTIGFADGENLKITNPHPLFTRNGWKAIDSVAAGWHNPGLPITKLLPGDFVANEDGSWKEVTAISCSTGFFKVYNLTVDNNHDYFAGGFLAHNKVGVSIPGGGTVYLNDNGGIIRRTSGGGGGTATPPQPAGSPTPPPPNAGTRTLFCPNGCTTTDITIQGAAPGTVGYQYPGSNNVAGFYAVLQTGGGIKYYPIAENAGGPSSQDLAYIYVNRAAAALTGGTIPEGGVKAMCQKDTAIVAKDCGTVAGLSQYLTNVPDSINNIVLKINDPATSAALRLTLLAQLKTYSDLGLVKTDSYTQISSKFISQADYTKCLANNSPSECSPITQNLGQPIVTKDVGRVLSIVSALRAGGDQNALLAELKTFVTSGVITQEYYNQVFDNVLALNQAKAAANAAQNIAAIKAANQDALTALDRFQRAAGNTTLTDAERNAIQKYCFDLGKTSSECQNIVTFSRNYLGLNTLTVTNPTTGEKTVLPAPNAAIPISNTEIATITTSVPKGFVLTPTKIIVENDPVFKNIPGFANLVGAYQSVTFSWQKMGFKSQQDCLEHAVGQAKRGCSTYEITAPQAAAAIQVGTGITSAGALLGVLAAGVPEIAAGVALKELAPVLFTQTLAIQAQNATGNAVSTCITDPQSGKCRDEGILAGLSWLNVGAVDYIAKVGLAGTAKALQAAQIGNISLTAVNTAYTGYQVTQTCFGPNTTALGCGVSSVLTLAQLGAGVFQVKGLIQDLNAEKLLARLNYLDTVPKGEPITGAKFGQFPVSEAEPLAAAIPETAAQSSFTESKVGLNSIAPAEQAALGKAPEALVASPDELDQLIELEAATKATLDAPDVVLTNSRAASAEELAALKAKLDKNLVELRFGETTPSVLSARETTAANNALTDSLSGDLNTAVRSQGAPPLAEAGPEIRNMQTVNDELATALANAPEPAARPVAEAPAPAAAGENVLNTQKATFRTAETGGSIEDFPIPTTKDPKAATLTWNADGTLELNPNGSGSNVVRVGNKIALAPTKVAPGDIININSGNGPEFFRVGEFVDGHPTLNVVPDTLGPTEVPVVKTAPEITAQVKADQASLLTDTGLPDPALAAKDLDLYRSDLQKMADRNGLTLDLPPNPTKSDLLIAEADLERQNALRYNPSTPLDVAEYDVALAGTDLSTLPEGTLPKAPDEVLAKLRADFTFQEVTSEEVAVLKQEVNGLERQLDHDQMTGLLNKQGGAKGLSAEVAFARASNGKVAVIDIDLTNFKAVNDIFGHDTGDDLIKEIARLLRTSSDRPTDLVIHLSGDEFRLVLPDTDEVGAKAVVDRIKALLEARQNAANVNAAIKQVGADIGIAIWDGTETAAQLSKQADAAMYAAKAANKANLVAATAVGTLTSPISPVPAKPPTALQNVRNFFVDNWNALFANSERGGAVNPSRLTNAAQAAEQANPTLVGNIREFYTTRIADPLSSFSTTYIRDDRGFLPGFRRFLNPTEVPPLEPAAITENLNTKAAQINKAVASNNSSAMLDTKIGDPVVINEPQPNTIRVYRGVNTQEGNSILEQVSNMLRPEGGANPAVIEDINFRNLVKALADNPSEENFLKVIDAAPADAKLGLTRALNIVKSDQQSLGLNFKDALLREHFDTVGRIGGTSPYVSVTTDINEAFGNSRNGGIIVMDVDPARLSKVPGTASEFALHGFVNETEVTGFIPRYTTALSPTRLDPAEVAADLQRASGQLNSEIAAKYPPVTANAVTRTTVTNALNDLGNFVVTRNGRLFVGGVTLAVGLYSQRDIINNGVDIVVRNFAGAGQNIFNLFSAPNTPTFNIRDWWNNLPFNKKPVTNIVPTSTVVNAPKPNQGAIVPNTPAQAEQPTSLQDNSKQFALTVKDTAGQNILAQPDSTPVPNGFLIIANSEGQKVASINILNSGLPLTVGDIKKLVIRIQNLGGLGQFMPFITIAQSNNVNGAFVTNLIAIDPQGHAAVNITISSKGDIQSNIDQALSDALKYGRYGPTQKSSLKLSYDLLFSSGRGGTPGNYFYYDPQAVLGAGKNFDAALAAYLSNPQALKQSSPAEFAFFDAVQKGYDPLSIQFVTQMGNPDTTKFGTTAIINNYKQQSVDQQFALSRITWSDLPSDTANASANYESLIEAASIRYHVPTAIIAGLILQESGGDPGQITDTGFGQKAVGLMQVTAGNTGKSVSDLRNASVNIDEGTRILSLIYYDPSLGNGNWRDTLALYNVGDWNSLLTGKLNGKTITSGGFTYADSVLKSAGVDPNQLKTVPAPVQPVGANPAPKVSAGTPLSAQTSQIKATTYGSNIINPQFTSPSSANPYEYVPSWFYTKVLPKLNLTCNSQAECLKLYKSLPLADGNGEIQLSLQPNYVPDDLVNMNNYNIPVVTILDSTSAGGNNKLISQNAAPMVEKLMNDLKAAGYGVTISYGYRSYQDQTVTREGFGIQAATPGESMHQGGVAIDIFMTRPNGGINPNKPLLNKDQINQILNNDGFVRPFPGTDPPHVVALDAIVPGLTKTLIDAGIDPNDKTIVKQVLLGVAQTYEFEAGVTP